MVGAFDPTCATFVQGFATACDAHIDNMRGGQTAGGPPSVRDGFKELRPGVCERPPWRSSAHRRAPCRRPKGRYSVRTRLRTVAVALGMGTCAVSQAIEHARASAGDVVVTSRARIAPPSASSCPPGAMRDDARARESGLEAAVRKRRLEALMASASHADAARLERGGRHPGSSVEGASSASASRALAGDGSRSR